VDLLNGAVLSGTYIKGLSHSLLCYSKCREVSDSLSAPHRDTSMPFILTSRDDNTGTRSHINAVTHTQTVTHHLNNIFHSCCSSQWPPMWLLCVDMCEKCGHGNRHRCTWTQKHLHTQRIPLCAVMSPCRKSPLHPVMLWYPMSTIKCPLT